LLELQCTDTPAIFCPSLLRW